MSEKNRLSRQSRKNPPTKVQPGRRYLIIGLCLIASTAAAIAGFRAVASTKSEINAGAAPASGDVVYPVNKFDDGKAQHFEYRTSDGPTVRYFVMKSSDGVIRAAFDACVVCWREGKGYVQKDDAMVCRNCGRRFPSTKINEVTGGCNPAPLTREVEGDKLIIKAANIQAGKQLFAF